VIVRSHNFDLPKQGQQGFEPGKQYYILLMVFDDRVRDDEDRKRNEQRKQSYQQALSQNPNGHIPQGQG